MVVGAVPARAAGFQHRTVADRLAAALGGGGTAVLAQDRVSPLAAALQQGVTQQVVAQQVVSGLGGVGKTQLAAALAHDLLHQHAVGLAVWVAAGTRTGILAGYAQAARTLALPTAGDGDGDVEQAAVAFLAALATRERRWLVVLGDLSDPADIRDLWPPTTGCGATVVTNRRRDASLITGRTLIDVDVFTEQEAQAYLHERPPDALADDVAGVAADLGYLPLALDHAAAYMLDLELPCSAYRARFAQQHRRLDILFPDPATLFTGRPGRWPPHGRYRSPRPTSCPRAEWPGGWPGGSACSTRPVSPPAYSPPRPALAYLTSEIRQEDGVEVGPDEVGAGLAHLRRFNLATRTADTEVVRVHALVQRAIRDTLTPTHLDTVVLAAADALLACWPEVERDTDLATRLRANTTTPVPPPPTHPDHPRRDPLAQVPGHPQPGRHRPGHRCGRRTRPAPPPCPHAPRMVRIARTMRVRPAAPPPASGSRHPDTPGSTSAADLHNSARLLLRSLSFSE